MTRIFDTWHRQQLIPEEPFDLDVRFRIVGSAYTKLPVWELNPQETVAIWLCEIWTMRTFPFVSGSNVVMCVLIVPGFTNP